MEVKIGIQSVPRELVVETDTSADEIESQLASALSGDGHSLFALAMSKIGTEDNPLRVAIVGAGPSGFYATDGFCTHEEEILADGLVLGEIIECPRHQGRFHIPSGKAKSGPVCVDLRTYPTKVEADHIYIGLP